VFLDGWFAAKRLLLGARRVRRTRLYGVGAPKSGTNSVGAMWSSNVRARHEPEFHALIRMLLDRHHGRIGERDFIEWLRVRDRRLALEVDSSALNFDILDILVREFPDARFLLTVRDCYSALDSQVNQFLKVLARRHAIVTELGNVQLGADAHHYAPQERILEQYGAPNVDSLLRRWAYHVHHTLATVPVKRLLIVRTDQLTSRAFEIADFAGLPRRMVRLERAHANRNSAKRPVISEIDREFLERKVEQHCAPLMARFFPEIQSLDEVKI
jgi:hypothetical protein